MITKLFAVMAVIAMAITINKALLMPLRDFIKSTQRHDALLLPSPPTKMTYIPTEENADMELTLESQEISTEAQRGGMLGPSPCSAFFENLKTHWRNWWNRRTANAYRNLTKAMRDDPCYAHSWQCNIAMPIYDGAKGKLTIEEANQIADNLMKHLFDEPNKEAAK